MLLNKRKFSQVKTVSSICYMDPQWGVTYDKYGDTINECGQHF